MLFIELILLDHNCILNLLVGCKETLLWLRLFVVFLTKIVTKSTPCWEEKFLQVTCFDISPWKSLYLQRSCQVCELCVVTGITATPVSSSKAAILSSIMARVEIKKITNDIWVFHLSEVLDMAANHSFKEYAWSLKKHH